MASRFKRTSADRTASEKSVLLQNTLKKRLDEGVLKDSGVSLESFRSAPISVGGNDTSAEYNVAANLVRTAIDSAYGEGTYDSKLTDGQRDAAIYALTSNDGIRSSFDMPARGLADVTSGVETSVVGNESYQTTRFGMPTAAGAAMPFDYQVERRQASNEVFDDRNLTNFVRTTVGFHMLAARQTPAAEAMYPTYSLPPDSNGFEVECERPLVFNNIFHDVKGNTVDFNRHRKLLINAYQDPTILANRVTLLKPYFVAGDADNNKHFVDPLVIPPTEYGPSEHGEDFETSWFRPKAKFSLTGVCQNPTLARLGQADISDTIDHMVHLEKVLLQVVTADGTSYIPFNVEHLAYSGFNPAFEGQNRKLVLTASFEDITLHSGLQDINGVTPVALTTFINTYSDCRVMLEMDVNGRINIESSETTIGETSASVREVTTVTGSGVDAVVEPAEDSKVAAIKALFTSIELYGYKLKAFFTNFNRALTGPLVTSERYKDVHIIPLGAPITARLPVVDTANPTIDVTQPANTLMIRNTNNAFSQLFSFEAVLEQAQLALYGHNAAVPQIRAIGRWMLRRSWYDKQEFALADEIQSLTTSDRNANISAGICNKLRMMVNVGYYHTNFQAAMDVLGLGGAKPEIVLVCNPIVANYIWERGDSRTLGDGWKFDIVPDADNRLIRRDQDGNPVYPIYAFFKVPGIDGPHPLNFGNMIYKPDLTTQLPLTRDNRTTIEFTTQPWTLHVNHCPVLFCLEVSGLPEAASDMMTFKQTVQ